MPVEIVRITSILHEFLKDVLERYDRSINEQKIVLQSTHFKDMISIFGHLEIYIYIKTRKTR